MSSSTEGGTDPTGKTARYCPDRALPESAYHPGHGPHPSTRAAPPWHSQPWDGDTATIQSNSEYLWGVDLYNHGYFWEAHEAWEDLWRRAPADSVVREFLQGLIQCAGALLKKRTGHPRGAFRLAEKGLHKLDRVAARGEVFAGIALEPFAKRVRQFCQDDGTGAPLLVLQEI